MRSRPRLRLIPIAIALVATLASCGEPPVIAPPADPAAPSDKKDVELPDGLVTLMVRTPTAAPGERGGTSQQLDAVLRRMNGSVHENERHMLWESTDPEVATVDSTGLVTAQGVGRAQVLAWYKDKAADTVEVEVVPVPVASVRLDGVDSLSLDDTTSYTATALDSAGEALVGRAVEWKSLAPAIASVSADGEVVALALGATDVSATIEEKTASIALQVWPQPVASVDVTPGDVSVPQFHKVRFMATPRDRRGKALTGRAVTWSSSAPEIVAFRASTDTAQGKDLGQAIVRATVEGKVGEASVTVTTPVEARALWVNRFEYTTSTAVDFPKIATIFQKAASANFNVVYFQVRVSGDALYYSDIEPCSPRMCGVLGRTSTRPAQDPLDVALREAAKYGIQVHAWINAYTGFISGSAAACNQFVESTPMNWLKAHPEWSAAARNSATGAIMRQVDNCTSNTLANEYMFVSPAVPEVRTQVARVSADLARRYGPKGLHGIHLDRIRFPSQVTGHNRFGWDQATQEGYRQQTGALPTSDFTAAFVSFRRELVNKGVREVWDSVQVVNPALVLSAAVFPGYQQPAGWGSAIYGFTEIFQDPQAWAQGGYLDVEVPMNYPATPTSTSWTVKAYGTSLDWTWTMDDHVRRIERNSGRQVYVGVGAIRGWAEMKAQLDLAHDRSITGMSVYSYSLVDAIPNGWAMLAAGPFKYKATVPAMTWK